MMPLNLWNRGGRWHIFCTDRGTCHGRHCQGTRNYFHMPVYPDLIEEVKVDIALIGQGMTKVREQGTETETRISSAEDTLHPLWESATAWQSQIQQLAQKHNDLENHACRSNLRFIGLSEGSKGHDPVTFLENLLTTTFGRETFSTTFVVKARGCTAPLRHLQRVS